MTEEKAIPRRSPKSVFFWTLCVSFPVLLLISGACIALCPRVYRSQAFVEFSVEPTNFMVMGESLNEQVLNEMRVLDSVELKKQVILELQLDAIWGKRFNNGEKLSLEKALETLKGRTDLKYYGQGSRQIGITIYDEDPIEPAKIANRLATNYCVHFTSRRGISAKILAAAPVHAQMFYFPLVFQFSALMVGSVLLALLISFVAMRIAIAHAKIVRVPTSNSAGESTPFRFKKY